MSRSTTVNRKFDCHVTRALLDIRSHHSRPNSSSVLESNCSRHSSWWIDALFAREIPDGAVLRWCSSVIKPFLNRLPTDWVIVLQKSLIHRWLSRSCVFRNLVLSTFLISGVVSIHILLSWEIMKNFRFAEKYYHTEMSQRFQYFEPSNNLNHVGSLLIFAAFDDENSLSAELSNFLSVTSQKGKMFDSPPHNLLLQNGLRPTDKRIRGAYRPEPLAADWIVVLLSCPINQCPLLRKYFHLSPPSSSLIRWSDRLISFGAYWMNEWMFGCSVVSMTLWPAQKTTRRLRPSPFSSSFSHCSTSQTQSIWRRRRTVSSDYHFPFPSFSSTFSSFFSCPKVVSAPPEYCFCLVWLFLASAFLVLTHSSQSLLFRIYTWEKARKNG